MVKEVYIDQYIKDIYEDIKKGENFIVKDKNNKIIGILSNEKIIKYLLNQNTKIEKLYTKMKPIEYTSDLILLSKVFLDHNTRIILLNKNNNIVGYTIFDLLKEILDKDKDLLLKYRAEEVMNEPVIINYKEDIEKALGIMRSNGVSRMVVVDDNNNAIGLLSVSDIIRFLLEEDKEKRIYEEKEKIEVRSIINNNLIFANKEDDLSKVINLLINNNIFSVPVLDNNKPLGIITAKDILAFYIAIKKESTHRIIIHGMSLDEIDMNHIDSKLENLIRKYGDILGSNAKVILHIKKIREHKEFFRRNLFFKIRAKLIGDKIILYSDTEALGLYEGINEIFNIFESQLESKKNRNKRDYLMERINKEYFDYL